MSDELPDLLSSLGSAPTVSLSSASDLVSPDSPQCPRRVLPDGARSPKLHPYADLPIIAFTTDAHGMWPLLEILNLALQCSRIAARLLI